MADQCHMCLLGLIILCSLLTGMTVTEETHVFRTSGENVHLPCNNALPGCTSTTWIYTRHSDAVKLIAGGIKKNNIERRERLSLGSDCSLNIKKVTQEDYGLYACQQYVNGQRTDAPVYLHFLHVSSSSSQTEIRPGSSVTLSCQLYFYDRYPCDTLVRSDGIQLVWVNQAGVSVMTDSRYQISFSSTHCISNLTTTLLNEDLNREWRCLVTQRKQLKTSATYTVKYSAPVDSTTLIPVRNSNSEKKSSRTTAAAPTQQENRIITSNSGVTSAAHRSSFTQQVSIFEFTQHGTSVASTTEKTQIPDTAPKFEVSMDAGSLFRVIMIIVETAVFAAPTVILLQIICARRAGRKDSHHPEEIEMPTTVLE
ncbi:uncharacterized protein [Chanodichthys erythropterus]|uniref:uncharacterized protein n=1 Tax=Chanodichthys erythropterus TaxID=933992 RepID=UPI00351F1E68